MAKLVRLCLVICLVVGFVGSVAFLMWAGMVEEGQRSFIRQLVGTYLPVMVGVAVCFVIATLLLLFELNLKSSELKKQPEQAVEPANPDREKLYEVIERMKANSRH